ncbi:hypothetical protein EV360DRAFT_70564 [Lentinula raphanica]|nr:hypothetical protein EV360DRAFT_70564 [Lentinula raphanica]
MILSITLNLNLKALPNLPDNENSGSLSGISIFHRHRYRPIIPAIAGICLVLLALLTVTHFLSVDSGVIAAPLVSRAPPPIENPVVLHPLYAEDGSLSVYLAVGSDKFCIQDDCEQLPTWSPSQLSLGYVQFADDNERVRVMKKTDNVGKVKVVKKPEGANEVEGKGKEAETETEKGEGGDHDILGICWQDHDHSLPWANFSPTPGGVTEIHLLEYHYINRSNNKTGGICLRIGPDNYFLNRRGIDGPFSPPRALLRIGYVSFTKTRILDLHSYLKEEMPTQNIETWVQELKGQLEDVHWHKTANSRYLHRWAYLHKLMNLLSKTSSGLSQPPQIITKKTWNIWMSKMGKGVRALKAKSVRNQVAKQRRRERPRANESS